MNAARGPIADTSAGAASDPSATPPIASPQSTPRTRVRSSSGTIRWMSVNMATSSTLFAAPTTASKTSAAASSGHGAKSAIGSPQNTSAMPNVPANRRDPSVTAPTAPTRPPTPIAAVM